jgi:hypothetical protein
MSVIKRILVALGLEKLNRSAKVTQGNATHTAMTNDPVTYPVLVFGALLADLLAKTDALSVADAATETGSHLSFDEAETAEIAWDTSMRALAAAIQTKANANPTIAAEIIHGAALKSKREPDKKGPAIPVSGLTASVTGLGNAIKLGFKSINPYGTQYDIQMTTTPAIESSWEAIALITARRTLVEELVNGTRYYFRVRAINSLGKSIFSDVVTQVAA